MELFIKKFNELNTDELYEILQLRAQVFVVEQDCVYPDLDGKDQNSTHIYYMSDGKVCAYARIFGPGDYFKYASIGRVVVHPDFRGLKYGYLLVNSSIQAICDLYKTKEIQISAQLYLQKFYESHGFVKKGGVYLEDGIEHISMKI